MISSLNEENWELFNTHLHSKYIILLCYSSHVLLTYCTYLSATFKTTKQRDKVTTNPRWSFVEQTKPDQTQIQGWLISLSRLPISTRTRILRSTTKQQHSISGIYMPPQAANGSIYHYEYNDYNTTTNLYNDE